MSDPYFDRPDKAKPTPARRNAPRMAFAGAIFAGAVIALAIGWFAATSRVEPVTATAFVPTLNAGLSPTGPTATPVRETLTPLVVDPATE